jgi:hypothetical protein
VKIGRALWRVGYVLAFIIIAVWVFAVARYDPWRRDRVVAAMRPGSTWPLAVQQGEGAAFPNGAEFAVFCMAADGPAAEFVRQSSGAYRVVQNGRVEPEGQFTRRVQTSDEHFADRARWAQAVSDLGQHLRCESLSIIWPPTDQLVAELDGEGRLIRVSTAPVDVD